MPSTAIMQPKLDIDHPHDGETIGLSHYSFRVGADASLISVEVSIDRGPWKACRRSCGYWWFDWTGYAAGEHVLVARGQTRDGFSTGSAPRRFTAAARRP